MMIYLLDLNRTLVSNHASTREIRPFSERLEAEEYRQDLVDAIKGETVIIITARPDYQGKATVLNVLRKTGWNPQDAWFNDLNLGPPSIKESTLKRFVFPKYGEPSGQFPAKESNPKAREMYARYAINAMPYELFIKHQV